MFTTLKSLGTAALLFSLAFVPQLSAQGGPGHGGPGGGGNAALLSYINSLPLEFVDAQEEAELILMRKEEKLARDVYKVLHYFNGVPSFQNIARAEQEHMDLVGMMLSRYGIPDPLPSVEAIGLYGDPVFDQLFLILASFGVQSIVNAEMVGAYIEDLDISDLDDAIAQTDNRDIGTVWQNLQRGSRNHLRAYYGQLASNGVIYPGYVLPTSTILAIVNAPHETGAVDENGNPL